MTDQDSAQQTISDFSDSQSSSNQTEAEDLSSPPNATDPRELYEWLQRDDTSPNLASDKLSVLVDKIRQDESGSLSAVQCLSVILEHTEHHVDCPELIYLLSNDLVDTKLILDSIVGCFPKDDFSIDSIDLTCIEDLSHSDRMEAYRILSRLPPSDEIYHQLKQVTEIFDERVEVGGRTYPVDSYFKGYAMRSLNTAIEYPHTTSQQLLEKIVTENPRESIRLIAGKAGQIRNLSAIDYLIDRLDCTDMLVSVQSGNIVKHLCAAYIDTEDSDLQLKYGQLAQRGLEAGLYPNQWEQFVPALFELDRHTFDKSETAELLATVFATVRTDEISKIREVCPPTEFRKRITNHPQVWMPVLTVFANKWPALIAEVIDEIVLLTRDCSGPNRTSICEAVAEVADSHPEQVLSAIDPLVRDLNRAQSGQEVKDIGEILQALEIYPPPPQLSELYGSADEEIDSAAKSVVASLRRIFNNSTPDLVPGKVDGITDLSSDYSLVKRADATTWTEPELEFSEIALINNIAKTALATQSDADANESVESVLGNILGEEYDCISDADPSIQFIVPSVDSGWIEFAILGAAFAQIINPNLDVAMHTPATGGWGTKKGIKNILSQYGMIRSGDNRTQVIPIVDLVPTARITNGERHIENSSTTVGDTQTCLTLMRNIKSVNEASVDIVLYNWLTGIDATDAAQIQSWRGKIEDSTTENQLDEGHNQIAYSATLDGLATMDDADEFAPLPSHPESPVHIEMYGIFAQQYAAGRCQHIGPPIDLPYPAVVGDNSHSTESQAEDEMGSRGHAATTLTEGTSTVELRSIDSEASVGELISQLDQYAEKIGDTTASRAVRKFRYTVGSLPVPIKLHDSWVQQQIDQGNRWVPQRIHSRRNRVEALVENATLDTEILDNALTTIDTLCNRLAEANPLGEELLSVLDDAAAREKSVGVLCSKKTYKDMLNTFFTERLSDWASRDGILLLDEDSVREVHRDDIDWLITFDPLSPQTAIYYHHPAVAKTIVLGHTEGSLPTRLHGIERKRRPFLPKQTDRSLPEFEVTMQGSEIDTNVDQSLTDQLYQTYLSVAGRSQENRTDSRNSTGTIHRYHVEFEEIEPTTLVDSHPVIARSDRHLATTGEFALRQLETITSGDEIVLIGNELRNNLWEDFLREDWDDDEADTEAAFIDAVQLWYDAVHTGLEENSPTGEPSDGLNDFANEIASDVSVTSRTVKDWAKGVLKADSPSELIFRSDLRIAPRHAEGVEVIANKYGTDRIAEHWEQAFARIKTIRATHRQRGGVFWEWLMDRACSGELFNEPNANVATVTHIRRIESES